jgi:hypothetical protein
MRQASAIGTCALSGGKSDGGCSAAQGVAYLSHPALLGRTASARWPIVIGRWFLPPARLSSRLPNVLADRQLRSGTAGRHSGDQHNHNGSHRSNSVAARFLFGRFRGICRHPLRFIPIDHCLSRDPYPTGRTIVPTDRRRHRDSCQVPESDPAPVRRFAESASGLCEALGSEHSAEAPKACHSKRDRV